MNVRRPLKTATKHNDLFGPGANIHLNACVGRNGGPADFGRYASGYFIAGAMLVKCLQERSRDVDLVVYPLVMNYRHGVEDILKQLAATVSFLCTGRKEVCYTHKLVDNWAIVKRYLPEIEVPEADIDQAELIIRDLVEIDPNGETFRYPISSRGDVHLEGTSLINVEVFGKGMASLAESLESWLIWAAYNLDLKAEMEREMRNTGY
jgi:hypothetical protein